MLRLGPGLTICRETSASRVPTGRNVNNVGRVSIKGSRAAEHDKNTWPELEKLARGHLEAGIHFQRMKVFHVAEETEH